MPNSIKKQILEYLKNRDYTWAGTIEKDIIDIYPCKADVVGRKCRELYREGKLDREYGRIENAEGKAVWAVKYRLAVPEPITANTTVNLRPVGELVRSLF